jgi:hypothetical protein
VLGELDADPARAKRVTVRSAEHQVVVVVLLLLFSAFEVLGVRVRT